MSPHPITVSTIAAATLAPNPINPTRFMTAFAFSPRANQVRNAASDDKGWTKS